MARELEKKKIGNHNYEMSLLGATASYKLFHKLFKMLGPSFGMVMDAVSEVEDVGSLDLAGGAATKAIRTLSEDISEESLEHLIDTLKAETQVNGQPLEGVFEVHFQGDIAGMFKWLIWGLKVQYKTFFGAFGSIFKAKAEEVQVVESNSQ